MPQDQQEVKKKVRPFKWSRFIRHTKAMLHRQFKNFIFVMEFGLLQLAIVASVAVTVFFFYQSFIFFIITVSCMGALYISHMTVFMFYIPTVKHLIFEDQVDSAEQKPQELVDEEQPPVIEGEGYWNSIKKGFKTCKTSISKCCSSTYNSCLKPCVSTVWKGTRVVLFVFGSILLLDIPIWFYQVRKCDNMDDYQEILSFILGYFAIFSFIPMVFASSIWMINNPHYVPIFGLDIVTLHLLMNICLFLIVIGAIIGLYHLQFFKKHSDTLDSIFWGFVRFIELVSKVLLISYIIKYSLYQLVPLAFVGTVYFFYVLGCTIVFPAYSESENRLVSFLKAFLLNLYARVLYLPYKESPCLMASLTAYISYSEKRERASAAAVQDETKATPRRLLFAPDSWDKIMILNNPNKKESGFTRRAYTHTVHALRFIENLNLMLFCIALSVIEGTMMDYVEPQKASLYYFGKPCSVLFTAMMFAYYVGSGIRTVHYSQHDLSQTDE